jgi:uncharacterized protein (DUF488 family)
MGRACGEVTVSGNGKEDGSAAGDLRIYTIGHSTLGIDQFLELLRHYQIGAVVDVRTIPRSLHNPQFNKESLSPFLRIRRIKYFHVKELGGLRRHVKDNPTNAGWQNASFRGFADYMQTPPFKVGMETLLRVAGMRPTAVMCAEAVPWRCHRSLIADALLVRGFEVIDIFSLSSSKPHSLNPMAVVHGSELTYPAPGAAKEAAAV